MASRDFNPFDMFRQLEQDLRHTTGAALRGVIFQPGLDMYETPQALVVKIELAGVKPDRINVELSADNRYLTVDGERLESLEDHRDRLRCFHLEIFYGKFQREIALPGNIRLDRDHLNASYRDGFLMITLPKIAGEATEKRNIPITNE